MREEGTFSKLKFVLLFESEAALGSLIGLILEIRSRDTWKCRAKAPTVCRLLRGVLFV